MNHSELYETVPFPSERGLIKITRTVNRCDFCEHWHEHVEMLYVERGMGKMLCHDTVYHLKPGDLVIANSNTLHAGKGSSPDFSYLCLIYSNSLFAVCQNEGYPVFQPFISQDPQIRTILQTVSDAIDDGKDYDIFSKISAAYRLLFYLSTNYCIRRLSDSDFRFRLKNQDRLNTVTAYIQEHLGSPDLSNKELSDLVHVNEYHFCHIFSAAFHQSPRSYIQKKRMEHAGHLLTHTELPVTEIGRKCGMEPNYFSRSFHKEFGVSPQEYRKQNPIRSFNADGILPLDS